jgi:hypothetical protein
MSVIYNIVYFAVPGLVGNLSLEAGSHSIIVNWNKPIDDSYCVKEYIIYWEHTQSGNNYTKTVQSDENSCVIEDLIACVEYAVSVKAMNDKDEKTDAVTCNTKTDSVGNYYAQVILLYLLRECTKMRGNGDVVSFSLDV